MNNILKTGLLTLMVGTLASCEDVFTPSPENNLPLDYLEENANYAQNVLGNVYMYIPGFQFNEPATDDAVSNEADNSWRQMAAGRWTSVSNPMNRWETCRSAIQYCNIFLSELDKVTWTSDPKANALFHDRFYGEAHALRGIMSYFLLQAHAGVDQSGQLLGYPIVKVAEDASSDFNVPRNTFVECINDINSDFETALKYLPTEYGEEYYTELAGKYPEASASSIARVFGPEFQGRVSGRVIKGFVSRIKLLAASPAFEASGVTWAEAADAAAELIDRDGYLMEVPVLGGTWYCDPDMQNLTDGGCPDEVIWRDVKGNSHDREESYFPPTLYGNGRMNPTQNLVDAFPMENGYPIDAPQSSYDKTNPYAGRDLRLAQYILYNGGRAGTDNKEISTISDDTNDGIDMISTSTRTGYYMKKHLRQDVNCNPSNRVDQLHYNARLRYTEFLLNYAEAANEAWGPKGTGSHSFSAYDVIREIRIRAGLGFENGDAYLRECAASKEAMRELIRNERRIELCFEGFRFYDLRRWKVSLEKLNEPAMGITIVDGVYTPFTVETRNYQPHMYYGPIPYSETLKFSNLQQNAGW
ncbi:MAG: RagB/SusD family nutrient uptake outer membrane protein [Muribaculaceae bacterium]|nr:RagB/SusD family nutrient uptake outer membrane protein [Muribaculaceae bacterium]